MKLFCISGFLGHPSDWKKSIPDALPTVSFDFFSKSAPPLYPFTLLGIGAFLNRVAASTEEKKILLGYSLGGRIALHALIQAPQLWAGAVMVSAHPGLSDCEERQKRRVSDEAWASRFEVEEWAQVMSDWNAQPVFQGGTAVLHRPEGQYSRPTLAATLRDLSLGTQEDLRPKITQLSIPLLWIAGERDSKFVRLGAEVSTLSSHFSFAVISNSGHRVLWDQPELLKNKIRDFLKPF